MFEYAQNKNPALCAVRGCRKPRASKKHRKCHCHIRALWRFNNPIKAAFADLRGNAKKRGKGFSLTIEEFTDFVTASDYMARRGTGNECLQIDRIRNAEGYHKDNLQILTGKQNKHKYTREHYTGLEDHEDDLEQPKDYEENPNNPF